MPKTWPKLKKPGTPGWKPMKPVRKPAPIPKPLPSGHVGRGRARPVPKPIKRGAKKMLPRKAFAKLRPIKAKPKGKVRVKKQVRPGVRGVG